MKEVCRKPVLGVWTTPCIHVPKFSARAQVTARPSRSRQKQNVDPGKLHRFPSNVGIAPLTDHHGWNGEVFPWPPPPPPFLLAPSSNGQVPKYECWLQDSSLGSGDSSVVRAPDSWSKGRGFESLLERRENFLLQGQFSVLTLFRYPFHPRVTAVARKRPRSFCQKRRWQVTAKHAYTLRMWLYMKWHGAWLYGVHRTRRDGSRCLWHQPCQRCKYTTSVDIQNAL